MPMETGKVIKSYNVKDVPITDLVIKYVEAMESETRIKTLKIKGNN